MTIGADVSGSGIHPPRPRKVGGAHPTRWYGIASTLFWIDTDHDLIGIYLVQHQPFEMSLGNRFRELTCEAASPP